MTGGQGRDLVLPPVDDIFRAVARSIVPEAETLSPQAWDALEDIVEHALAERPPSMRRQLQLFLRHHLVALGADHLTRAGCRHCYCYWIHQHHHRSHPNQLY